MHIIQNCAPTSSLSAPLVLTMWTRGRNSFGPCRTNKERVDIYSSCRIFQNHKTLMTKFVTMDDAKKGKIPLKDYSLAASINAQIDIDGNPKFILNNPCPNGANRSSQSFISIKDYGGRKDGRGLKLRQRDLIKMGNKTVRIVQLKSEMPDFSMATDEFDDYRRQRNSFYFHENMQGGTCKICLSEETDANDFIMKPCKCKGSCSDVHFGCLKKWMETKVSISGSPQSKILTHCFKKFQCQICKSELPRCIIRDNILHYLFTPRVPFGQPYLMLEVEGESSWHTITLKEFETVQIGRSLVSDIVVSSPEVSKMHCEISFANGSFYIKDLHSELGTFLQLKQGFQISSTAMIEHMGVFYEFQPEGPKNSTKQARLFS